MNQKEQAEFEELKEMLEQFESAHSREETISFNEEEFEDIIHYYLKNNEPQKALNASEMALTLFPFSSEFCLTKADAHLELGELEEAEFYLTNNFKIDKSDVDYYIILSEIYVLKNEYPRAIEICHDGLEKCKDNLDSLLLHLAEIHDFQGEYKEVIPLVEETLSLNPKNEDALYLYSITMSILDRVQDKVDFIKSLLDKDPFNEDAWYYLGMAYRELGLYERAIECLEYIEAIDEDVNVLSDIAQIYFEAKLYKEAIQALKDLEKKSDFYFTDFMVYGLSYKFLGEYHRAKQYLKEALSFDEQVEEVYYELAAIFYDESKPEAALPLIVKALEKNDEVAHYLELKADIFIALDRFEEACELYIRIIQLNNSTPYYLSKFAYISAVRFGLEEAIAILDNGIQDYHHEALHFHKSILYFLFENEEQGYFEFALGLEKDFDAHTIVFDKLPELKTSVRMLQILSLYDEN